jgi:hypothetical protein
MRIAIQTIIFGGLMNLGVVYIKSFLLIISVSFVFSFGIASLLRFFRRVSWQPIFAIAITIWLCIGFFGLNNWHEKLFNAWHRWQNEAMPSKGCITYEPDFTRLFATYRMTRPEFEAWVTSHPWKLNPGDNGLLYHDRGRLGFNSPELSFETETAPNGKQLRVYFESGIMYVSYNSM